MKKQKWVCPNGCETDVVLVCGGNPYPDADIDDPDVMFQMTTEGDYTNRFADGTIGVPKECHEFADGGDCMEPICPYCQALCINVAENESEETA